MHLHKINKKLWLVFPFFEPSSLELIKIINKIKQQNDKLNIIVIDDGAGKGVLQDINGVNIIRHKQRLGKGSAIITAIKYINDLTEKINKYKNFILTADSDGQHCAEDILKIITEWENNISDEKKSKTLMIGERDFRKSGVPLSSKIGKIVSTLLIKLETGKYIYDTQSGLRIYPLSLFKNKSFFFSGFEFETETLVYAIINGFELKTIPIKTIYNKEIKSNFKKISDSLKILYLHFKIITSLIKIKFLQKTITIPFFRNKIIM